MSAITGMPSGLSQAQQMEWMQARIVQLEQAKATRQSSELSFKVSEKGAVSVYGLNSRFPVTLYYEQWLRLIEAIERLKLFMAAHKPELAVKPPKS